MGVERPVVCAFGSNGVLSGVCVHYRSCAVNDVSFVLRENDLSFELLSFARCTPVVRVCAAGPKWKRHVVSCYQAICCPCLQKLIFSTKQNDIVLGEQKQRRFA